MIVLEPGNVMLALFLAMMIGLPAGLLAAGIRFVLEQVPQKPIRWLIPVIIAVATFAVSLVFFGHPETPESYQQHWLFMMISGFLLYASFLLVSFPLFEKYFTRSPPYGVILFAGIVTFFILALLGIIGGDRAYAGEGSQMLLDIVITDSALLVVPAIIYGAIAFLDTALYGEPGKKSP
ncbi:hypothetical protein [Methanoregula sp.]|jgi:hypothetical protein|uniref:hypothetical protein n=1 Tax=Methanoregula sp. TaxID=2052170 RepID=UPI003567CD19